MISCRDCCFFISRINLTEGDSEEGLGECRCKPPTGVRQWPCVDEGDCCGEGEESAAAHLRVVDADQARRKESFEAECARRSAFCNDEARKKKLKTTSRKHRGGGQPK